MPEHVHKAGEWCDHCARAQDVARQAKYDYQTNSWVHDGLTVNRITLTTDGETYGPTPQGVTLLVDHVLFHSASSMWGYQGTLPGLFYNNELIAPLYSGVVADPTDTNFPYGANVCLTGHLNLHGLALPPGGTFALHTTGYPSIITTTVVYRTRVVVPAPSDVSKRMFFIPSITPDDSGEQSSNVRTPSAKPATVTELDSGSMKAGL